MLHNGWHDWWQNDRALVAALIVVMTGVWCWTRSAEVWDVVGLLIAALLTLITGASKKNGGAGTA